MKRCDGRRRICYVSSSSQTVGRPFGLFGVLTRLLEFSSHVWTLFFRSPLEHMLYRRMCKLNLSKTTFTLKTAQFSG